MNDRLRQREHPREAPAKSDRPNMGRHLDASRSSWFAAIGGGAVGLVVGFFLAFIFCWFVWVRHYEVQVREKEQLLQRWQEQLRRDQDTITTAKNIATDQLKTWVATNRELQEQYSALQHQLHQREIELVSAGNTTVWLGLGGVVAVVVVVVFLLRDVNRRATITLESVASLAPEDMVRTVLVQALAAREEPLAITLEDRRERPRPQELPHNPKD